MQKIQQSIFINAPREKVWDTMLGEDTYPIWTKAFNPASTDPINGLRGDWSEGSKMLFIGTDADGNEGGMASRIAKNVPHEYLSIEHVAIIKNGVEDATSEEAQKWVPAFENYTFTEKNGGNELSIEQDMAEEYKEQFESMWSQALKDLKELAEK
jgi:uncharacterized protein YndB with AHSA1/START domain